VKKSTLVVGSLAAALLGLVALFIGVLIEPARAWFAYLAAWTFGVTVCVGALLLVMVGHASKGRWMVVTLRPAEAIVGALPLFALLFVPICFGLRQLYPWIDHPDPHKARYLSPGFFIARTALYFLVFITIGALLRRWSRRNDEDPSMARVLRMRRLAGGALPLVGLTLTWASFDWTMSLYPHWWSTIFGLYYFAGAFVAAIALVSVVLYVPAFGVGASVHATPEHAQALGRLLFAMVAFWAYMAFSQLLIYWIADIPAEIPFYAARTRGSWSGVTYLLVCGNFVAPFFLLLNRQWKRRGDYLALVGAWLFMMHYVDVYWLVLPVHDARGADPDWLDLGAILFVGGVSCAWIARRWAGAPPLPRHAPDLAEGLSYEAAL
jgi:hypothetical protein